MLLNLIQVCKFCISKIMDRNSTLKFEFKYNLKRQNETEDHSRRSGQNTNVQTVLESPAALP